MEISEGKNDRKNCETFLKERENIRK